MFKKITQSVYFYIALLIVLNIFMAVFCVSPGFKIVGDAGSYHEAIKFIEGQPISGSIPFHRLLTTPFMLLSSRLFDYFFHNIYGSMAAVNIIFYKLAFEIYKDKKTAFFSCVLLASNYYLFNIDNAFIADLGGRFFLILTDLLAVKYFLNQDKKYYYLAILSSSVGVLFKEFGALGFLSLICLILFLPVNWKEKIKIILKSGALFAIVPLAFHLFFYYKFSFSYFDWYKTSLNFYPPEMHQYGIVLFLKVMGWLFLAGWPLFLWGLWQEKKFFDGQRFKILLALFPASVAFFAWPMFMQRTAFVLVPWLSLVSGFGLSKIKIKFLPFILLIVYMAVNYNLERLMLLINLPFK